MNEQVDSWRRLPEDVARKYLQSRKADRGGLSRNPWWIRARRQMRCIARRRGVLILGVFRRPTTRRGAERGRAPAGGYGTAFGPFSGSGRQLPGQPAQLGRLLERSAALVVVEVVHLDRLVLRAA